MGEVWRARDQRIGRDVAIKILSTAWGMGDQAARRFEQEARAAGALNHPGLVTIFDVGTTDGSPYIVMELLEGQTLREALGELMPVPLPLRKAIDYGIQIASALAVAHEKRIVHRDLKPENILITTDGRVKILDFGLAKLVADANEIDPRRLTARNLTNAGIAVGTPAYMSPEQARALAVDHRTDIFSLGTVLYEMLSGHTPFEDVEAMDMMNAVVDRDPPPLTSIDPSIPPALDAIVNHCLEKNPAERFQSARDLAFQLRLLTGQQNTTADLLPRAPSSAPAALQSASAGTRPVAKKRLGRPVVVAIIAAVALLALAIGAGVALRRAPAAGSPLQARTFRQLTFADGLELFPALSPDGKSFAWVSAASGNRDIYVQRVDGRTAINVTSDSPDDDSEPAFSPDGSHIAFRSERDGGGIFIMGATGESVRRLSDIGHNPSWSPDGRRIAVSTAGVDLRPQVHTVNGQLWIIDAASGAKRLVEHAPASGAGSDTDVVQPVWSPHGKRIAFWGVSATSPQRDIWTIDPDAPQPKQTLVRVTTDAALHWNPLWSPDGRWLYFGSDADGTLNLWRVAIDETSGKPLAAPEPLSLPGSLNGDFSFAENGDLVFSAVTRSYRLLALPLDAKSGRTGAPRLLFSGSQEILSLAPSPDGQSIAFTTSGAQEDLFIANNDGTRLRQLTNDAARDRGPAWSPDGRTLYFYSNRGGVYKIWSIQTDGSELAPVTTEADFKRFGSIYEPDPSPDGRTLVAETHRGVALVHLDRPPSQRIELLSVAGGLPKWSPDGQRIAADQKGVLVYSLGTRQAERVAARGCCPRWMPDGRSVLFVDRQPAIVDLATRRVTEVALAPLPGVQLDYSTTLSRDGSTLYVRQTLEQGDIWLMHSGH
jgi:eukaryotic-like serine/threonine-protein kinase